MNIKKDLRTFLLKEIRQTGIALSAFAQQANINRGVLSATLREHSSKPLSFSLFQKIVQALNCDETLALEYYIEECFHSGKPNRSRVEPFLIRCGELGLVSYIEEMILRLNKVSFDLRDLMFEIGERLYVAGFIQNSVPFYEALVKCEKYTRSENLAISHYRLFRAKIVEEVEENLLLTLSFTPFYDELPYYHQLDAAMKLINIYFALNDMREAKYWIDKLFLLTQSLYQRGVESEWTVLPKGMEFSFVVYCGYSYLSMESLMFFDDLYLEAKSYNEQYKDLSWFPEIDEMTKQEVEKFKFHGEMNAMYIELGLGNEHMLSKCIKFIEKNSDEILIASSFILYFANEFNYNIDHFLEKYSDQIEALVYSNSVYSKNSYMVWNRYTSICVDTALYYFKRGHYQKALEHTRRGINAPIGINTDKFFFTRLAPIFEKFPTLIHPN